ncbi:hypothetical protein, partial [Sulfitobacter sp. HI0129]|uniref:hypothetical protein n=1 Tax=Sulfitobacter sp. HI0129 TaxID=1822268 RepID=UPI001F27C33D
STKGSEAQIAIFANSAFLFLNKRLCEQDSWNEAKIKRRSGDLFESAKKTGDIQAHLSPCFDGQSGTTCPMKAL